MVIRNELHVSRHLTSILDGNATGSHHQAIIHDDTVAADVNTPGTHDNQHRHNTGAFAGAALVTVGLGRINMTVAKFNSRFYSRSNIRIGNEPCSKSHFGNPDAIGKRVCFLQYVVYNQMVLFH